MKCSGFVLRCARLAGALPQGITWSLAKLSSPDQTSRSVGQFAAPSQPRSFWTPDPGSMFAAPIAVTIALGSIAFRHQQALQI